MTRASFIERHVLSSVLAAMAEANGDEETANNLRAQSRLRLIAMSEDELWELANVTANPPRRPAEKVYEEIKAAVEKHKQTKDMWLGDLLLCIRDQQEIDAG